jgi:hypothetical protein
MEYDYFTQKVIKQFVDKFDDVTKNEGSGIYASISSLKAFGDEIEIYMNT